MTKQYWFSILLIICSPILAMEPDFPLRILDGLEKPKDEKVIKVNNARVVIADYDLIKRDFSHLRWASKDEIDAWLISNVGYISMPQSQLNQVNYTINIDINTYRVAHRPWGYGRALVFTVENGLLDVKGTGVGTGVVPQNASHCNGLMTLGEAFREYAMQKLVEDIFSHYKKTINNSKLPLKTVQSYAVIDWGFDIIDDHSAFAKMNQNRTRAGAIVRQGHGREVIKGADNHFLSIDESFEIEMILRRYGITSSGNINEFIDIPDIQGTKEKYLVDFGTYICMYKFSKEVYLPLGVDREGESRSYKPKKNTSIAQPEKEICVPFLIWGHNICLNPLGKCSMDNMRMLGENFANILQYVDNIFLENFLANRNALMAPGDYLALVKITGDQQLSSVNANFGNKSYRRIIAALKNQIYSYIEYSLNCAKFKRDSQKYGKMVLCCCAQDYPSIQTIRRPNNQFF